MKDVKKIYFVGNAHLDPVWMWRWQEGAAEAKATIRSALDRMKEYPEFVFLCAASQVFAWIEEFDPAMFEEIRERVSEGRFLLMGGWWIQPDCNLPSGEGFARQSLYGQRYFYEKFGKTATIGYNVDSFGHNAMIPQILQKSGMNCYFFMRPSPAEKEMESDVFRWFSPDGSNVLAYRLMAKYNFFFNNLEELDEILGRTVAVEKNESGIGAVFYGVGNHGGGPTKRCIETVFDYRRAHPELEVCFAKGEDFFADLEQSGARIPELHDDLQHHASGCYAAVSEIKELVRRAETRLLSAETFDMMRARLCGRALQTRRLAEAWQNVLFCHFHDILGGCCIKDAYRDAREMMGESLSVAAKLENNALQVLSWSIDTSDASKGTPIILFNPHPFAVTESVQVNQQVERITDMSGAPVLLQAVHSPAACCKARTDTMFRATVPAYGYTTYFITPLAEEEAPLSEHPLRVWENGLENDCLRVEFEKHTGYITSIYDKLNDRELVEGYAAVPVVIDEYKHDTWSHALNFFTRELGSFADAELDVIEQGPIRVTLRVKSRYNDSQLVQYFSLTEGQAMLEVSAEVNWQEKHKLLKLAYPTTVTEPQAFYEIPFGEIERPCDGEEEPGHTWISVQNKQSGCAIINNNRYSFSVKASTMYLTVIRSPLYGDHDKGRDDLTPFTDQGLSEFRYAFLPIGVESRGELIRAAKQLNTPLTQIVENNHQGSLPLSYTGIACDAPNVFVSAFKAAEDGSGTVIRIYETDGKTTAVTLSGDLLPHPLSVTLTPYSVNTYLLPKGAEAWHEVLMTELEK